MRQEMDERAGDPESPQREMTALLGAVVERQQAEPTWRVRKDQGAAQGAQRLKVA